MVTFKPSWEGSKRNIDVVLKESSKIMPGLSNCHLSIKGQYFRANNSQHGDLRVASPDFEFLYLPRAGKFYPRSIFRLLAMFYFLTWVLVLWVNSLSSTFLSCVFFMYVISHTHVHRKRLNKVLHYERIVMQRGEAELLKWLFLDYFSAVPHSVQSTWQWKVLYGKVNKLDWKVQLWKGM